MKKILVVDDEPTILVVLGITLQRAGHTVVCASSCAGAISLFENDEQRDFDVLITDLEMGGKSSGIDVIKSIKSHRPGLTACLASGSLTPEIRARAMEVGADVILDKPYHPETLLKALGL